MDADKLISFFSKKIEEISSLRSLSGTEEPAFNKWWNSITATAERMGKEYVERTHHVHFYRQVIVGDYSAADEKQDYLRGLDQAQSFLEALIEELELWGFNGQLPNTASDKNPTAANGNIILNLTISQKQAQEITQTINLSQYDQDVQECVEQLLEELRKQNKDKNKIVGLVKWLADKGADALIAILLAGTNLTT